MSRRNQPDRHTMQIDRASYDSCERLVRSGSLIVQPRPDCEADDALKGVNAAVTYAVSPNTTLQVLHDEAVRIGNELVNARLSRLPTTAYRAMVRGAPAFAQHPGLQALYGRLRRGQISERWFQHELEMMVRQERRPNSTPSLVTLPRTLQSHWLPQEVFLFKNAAGDWFISLSFRTTAQPRTPNPARRPFGLDLGLRPVTVLSDGQQDYFFTLVALPFLRQESLSPAARALYNQLMYASGRADLDRVLGVLLHEASAVFAEKLTHRGMSAGFIHGGRRHAVHDYHFSWLPQYANAVRLPFHRPGAAWSSQTCSVCGARSRCSRKGDRFVCLTVSCQTSLDAHANAAREMLQRGLGVHAAPTFGA
ncbi:transposase [Deinococcus sp. QL22]|uniref:transposase n=1 Tax=Deinococcus sp. QL22 TaxID=2939437 RepID=UPI0020172EAD|nr:transposase [Deinococcus sp. QL22]UQN08774.1 transposase [Deinococcus sp. QL22]